MTVSTSEDESRRGHRNVRSTSEIGKPTGTRFLKATDAYVDGESVPEVNLMMEYGDALYAFRAAIAPEQEEAN